MTAPAHILVVDDDRSVAITIQAVLQQEGYATSAVFSVPAAEELLASELFDAALIDLRIDDADGIDLMRAIHSRQPHCSAIILTGYASLESAIRAIRQGAYDYLMKPCDLEELKLTMARAVERSTLRRALETRVDQLNEANATITALNSDLERRIAQRTEELVRTVGELAQAHERLEQVHKQRLEFVAMIAHELGQPLTTILGSAQLLARPMGDEDKREQLVGAIVAQSQRLQRLQRDLSDVSRMSTGRFRLEPVEADLAELVAVQVEAARQTTTSHSFTYEGPPDGIPAILDPDRIGQVLANVLGNAVKYTPGGTIRVALTLNDAGAEIAVCDEGPGIPIERQEAIFEPHIRLTGGSAQPQGAGLGLYIARGIAEAHAGRLTVQSAEGAGLTFTLTLPLRASQDAGAGRPRLTVTTPAGGRP